VFSFSQDTVVQYSIPYYVAIPIVLSPLKRKGVSTSTRSQAMHPRTLRTTRMAQPRGRPHSRSRAARHPHRRMRILHPI
jgi:hypothetical protein